MPKSFSASTGRLLDIFLCRKQTFSDCCGRIQSPLAFQYRHHLLDNHLRMRGSFKSTILLSISFLSHNKIQSLWSPNTYGSYLPHCCWVLVQCSLVFLSYRRSSPLHRGFPGQLWGWHLQFLCSSFALLIGPAFIGTVLIVYLQRWFVDVSKVPFTEKRPLQIVTADTAQPSCAGWSGPLDRVSNQIWRKGYNSPAHHAARFLPVPTPFLPMMCGAACGKPQLTAELAAELGPAFELVEVSINTTRLCWFTQGSYHCADVTLQPLNQHLLIVLCSGSEGSFGARTGDLWVLTMQWKYSNPQNRACCTSHISFADPFVQETEQCSRAICFILHKDGSHCSWEHRLYNFLLFRQHHAWQVSLPSC